MCGHSIGWKLFCCRSTCIVSLSSICSLRPVCWLLSSWCFVCIRRAAHISANRYANRYRYRYEYGYGYRSQVCICSVRYTTRTDSQPRTSPTATQRRFATSTPIRNPISYKPESHATARKPVTCSAALKTIPNVLSTATNQMSTIAAT